MTRILILSHCQYVALIFCVSSIFRFFFYILLYNIFIFVDDFWAFIYFSHLLAVQNILWGLILRKIDIYISSCYSFCTYERLQKWTGSKLSKSIHELVNEKILFNNIFKNFIVFSSFFRIIVSTADVVRQVICHLLFNWTWCFALIISLWYNWIFDW